MEKNYQFDFTQEYILYKTGILSKSERHLPYKSIQDVSVTQSLLERLFGLASVTIENAAQELSANGTISSSNINLVGLKLTNANIIAETVKEIALGKNSSQMGL